MRPWIVLAAVGIGVGVAALLALPRSEAPAPPQEARVALGAPPREAAPEPVAAPPAAPSSAASELLPEEDAPPEEAGIGAPQPQEEERPPEAAEPPPGLAPLFDGSGEPSRFLVRSSLESKIARDHPELDPSPAAFERATDAVFRIRAARREMEKLALDPANAPRRVILREQIQDALDEFQKNLGIPPVDFTKPVLTHSGTGEALAAEPDSYDAPPPETSR